MKPIIGVTTFRDKNGYASVSSNYTESIFASGGIPIPIPIIRNEKDYDCYLNIIDGIVFTGGVDISPLSYGENPIKQVNVVSSLRDEYEFELFKKAYENNMPILGICRGNQLINVALGGSLYQDINTQVPDTLGHSPDGISVDELFHSVNIIEGSRLHGIFKKQKFHVNSFHHQSIKDLGKNLSVSALSDDGVVEGIESSEKSFLIGVQWHPECLTKRYPEFLKLFKALVSATK